MNNKTIAIISVLISAAFLAFFIYDSMKKKESHKCNCASSVDPLTQNSGATGQTAATQPLVFA